MTSKTSSTENNVGLFDKLLDITETLAGEILKIKKEIGWGIYPSDEVFEILKKIKEMKGVK